MKDAQGPGLTPVDFDPFASGELRLTVPTTEPQREIWMSTQMGEEASLAYNESVSVVLRGALDVGRLNRAISEVIARHEALRATVSADGAHLCVSEEVAADLPVVDLGDLDVNARAARVDELVGEEVSRPFDLERGPLFRARLARLGPNEHRLFFTAHHIVCDGWSTAVILHELGVSYSGQSLPPPAPFSAYAVGQKSDAATLAWWRERFRDGAPIVDLPTDRPRPPVRTYAAGRVDHIIDSALFAKLKATGASHGCSLFHVLFAGYAAFLSRITRQADLVIGVPAAGQSRVGQDALVGHCVSLLPVRLRVDREASFARLLTEVRASMLDAHEHQQISFGELLQSLAVARDPSRIPLVSQVFNLDQGMDTFRFVGLEATFVSHARTCETFELNINASVVAATLGTESHVVLEAQYNSALFDRSTVAARMQELEVLLRAAVAEPTRPVGKLPLLPERERAQLLAWNATKRTYEGETRLHRRFEAQVDAAPDRTALEFEGKTMTYGELDRRANQLAHRLRALGVGPEVMVGVFMERSFEMIVGIYGTLKAGGAYVPLDPEYPHERLTFMVADAKPRVVLTQERLADRLPANASLVLRLDADAAELAQLPATRVTDLGGPRDAAYVIYTSGSSGRPKGVINEHAPVTNRLRWGDEMLGLTADDRWLQKTPFSFDVSVTELFGTLAIGATMVIAPPGAHRDGARMADLIASAGVTTAHFVPSMLPSFLEARGLERCRSLRRVIASGEALTPDLVQRFFARLPNVALHNFYGPTEAAVDVSHFQPRPGAEARVIPIGRPAANTTLHVVDEGLEPLPIGVPGELCIGGVQVARGYLDRPELDRERFVPDPFVAAEGARLYRTGDLCRVLPDGQIEFLGRLDFQVKVRGLRIELGEIEAVLEAHPAVEGAVVALREVRPGDARLVAYLRLAPGQEATPTELRRHARIALPDYMVPQHFVELATFPLTSSGKVDRRALPAPMQGAGASAERVPPRTPTELLLAKLWESVLGVSGVGVRDNFFDLGGHSLLALSVIARLREQGYVAEPRALILSSLEQVAAELDRAPRSSPPDRTSRTS